MQVPNAKSNALSTTPNSFLNMPPLKELTHIKEIPNIVFHARKYKSAYSSYCETNGIIFLKNW